MSRKDSLSRRAFAAGSEGHAMEVAVESFPTTDPYTAAKKLHRMLDGGQSGDLSPSWAVLDQILAVDPETVLRVLCEALGFEAPRRRALDVPSAIRELTTQMQEMQRTLVSLGQQQRQIAQADRAARSAPARKRA